MIILIVDGWVQPRQPLRHLPQRNQLYRQLVQNQGKLTSALMGAWKCSFPNLYEYHYERTATH